MPNLLADIIKPTIVREKAAVAGGKNCSNDENCRLQARNGLTARNKQCRTLLPTSIQNDDELKRLECKRFGVPGAAYCAVRRLQQKPRHAIRDQGTCYQFKTGYYSHDTRQGGRQVKTKGGKRRKETYVWLMRVAQPEAFRKGQFARAALVTKCRRREAIS